jgi:FdhE protein
VSDFGLLAGLRADRARTLGLRHPASREALAFYGEIALFQATIDPARPLASREALVALVTRAGPAVLRQAAEPLDETACREAMAHYLSLEDLGSPRSFFARVLLMPVFASKRETRGEIGQTFASSRTTDDSSAWRCPHCKHPPQVGILRPEGHGTASSLLCSLCLAESPFPRGRCPSCGEADEQRIAYYAAESLAHLQVQACEACRRYLHRVDLAKDPEAIPDVDEIVGLPLDVWANERGFRKVHPNLMGI